MARMGRLKARYVLAELRLVKPLGHEPSQATLALGRVEVGIAMKRMASKGRGALARDDQQDAMPPAAGRLKKTQESPPRFGSARAMQVQLRIIFKLSARQPPAQPAVKACQKRRLLRHGR
jgi:hypothetical protein